MPFGISPPLELCPPRRLTTAPLPSERALTPYCPPTAEPQSPNHSTAAHPPPKEKRTERTRHPPLPVLSCSSKMAAPMMLKPSWTTLRLAALLTLLANALLPSTAQPSKVTVGVSWGHLEGEWKIHEDALRARLSSLGAQYTRTDAKGSSARQLEDVDALAAKGVDVLIVVPANPEALRPGLARAQAAGIPVVAYDRPVPDPAAFYVGFDE
ncbi:MAG: hypothetical protein C4342_08205, partial [Armatimonadota bacterium]